MTNILTDKYEINKPSYLTQIVYFDSKSNTIAPINSTHLDLVNSMYYIINKSMKMDAIDEATKNVFWIVMKTIPGQKRSK